MLATGSSALANPAILDASSIAAKYRPDTTVISDIAQTVGDNPNVVSALLIAAVIALLVTPLVSRLALRVGAVDHPDYDRRVHLFATPLLGGLAIALGLGMAAVYSLDWTRVTHAQQVSTDQLATMLLCALGVVALGAVDDIWGLSWKPKLTAQSLIAVAAVLGPLLGGATSSVTQLLLVVRRLDPPFFGAAMLPNWLGIIVAALSIVALMNMMNFIDGVDGLAAGMTVISAVTFAIIAASYGRDSIAVLAGATAGGALGFLPHNFRRGGARIFMGDTGSMLLGFMLAVIAIQGVLKTAAAVSLVIPLTLLAIPLLDTLFVISKRMKHGVSLASADNWHLHHRLLNVGFSPRRVALAFWLWMSSLSFLALALRFVDFGSYGEWESDGLVILGLIGLGVFAVSVYLAVVLEIIKTPKVKARNASAAHNDLGSSGNSPNSAAVDSDKIPEL